ncbi:hypothetical protein D3C72_1535730 [compost metagenome]
MRVAHGLGLAGQVGKRDGGVAVAQGDGARILDLLQGASQFFGHGRRSDHSGRDGGAQQLTNDAHQIFLDVFVFFMEPLADSSFNEYRNKRLHSATKCRA